MMAKVVVALACVIGLSACGDEGMSNADMETAWNATNAALKKALIAAQLSNAASSDNFTLSSFSNNCGDSGTVALTGPYSSNATAKTVEYSFDAQFTACSEQSVVMAGTLQWVNASSAAYTQAVTWTGSIDYSGAVEGSCKLDLAMAAAGDGTTTTYAFSNTFCGKDAVLLGLSNTMPGI